MENSRILLDRFLIDPNNIDKLLKTYNYRCLDIARINMLEWKKIIQNRNTQGRKALLNGQTYNENENVVHLWFDDYTNNKIGFLNVGTFKYRVSCTDGKISVIIILITYFSTAVPLTSRGFFPVGL